MEKPAVKVSNSDRSDTAKMKLQENGEDDSRQESGATTKSTKKKPKKEDKWKQKMMFLYEDGANADEDVGESGSMETEAVEDSRYVNPT